MRIQGVQIFQLRPDHWTCIVRDHSSAFDEAQEGDPGDYILRSELLAATSILFRQMNEIVWLPEEERHVLKVIYKEGTLTATVLTFVHRKVRIVEATFDPSEANPTFTLNLRAVYSLNKEYYDKQIAFDVLKWMFCRPESIKKLAA
ncbi:hypothetical protein FQN54_007224 [Arachnomyces sp. PD_36]|nr:hypothetical protein FQN54_007224 [Arachnomyces sp. PD_36]